MISPRLLRSRRIWLIAVFLLIVGLLASLIRAHYRTERRAALAEQTRRSGDPWPRGTGHAILAPFAAPAEDKGWIEAGGSFSPAFRSFGLSIWVRDASGALVTTSDRLPLGLTRHHYELSSGQPAIAVETPHYRLRYAVVGQRAYRATISAPIRPGEQLELVLRSVGPAGAALTRIDVQPGGLLLDRRWRIGLPPGGRLVALGDETSGGMTASKAPPAGSFVEDRHGWAFARIALPAAGTAITIDDITASASPTTPFPQPAGCAGEGLPPALANLLTQHRRTLIEGLVGDETRPGDPINYPLAWQRDGAYVVVALARCGQGAVAQTLARDLARRDFFGGFGSEADAPGLALWALGEVAAASDDPDFVRSVWPDVQRKAELIERLRTAINPIRIAHQGPLIPRATRDPDVDLVADRAKGGLIVGRMDFHRPLYFVNAVSILGLRDAADMAETIGHDAAARRWIAQAEALRSAYRLKMRTEGADTEEAQDDRTLISGLYPSYAADPAMIRTLLARRAVLPDPGALPKWTYFTIAIAHQRLILGDRAGARQVADWFAAHDRVPGLGIIWEGDGEENSSGLWATARGNLRPTGVTPHYWSSAEMLLLATEMLAYVDLQQAPLLVIGAGLAPAELARPIEVDRIGTARGPVSWRWNGRDRIDVDLPRPMPVLLGAGFPKGVHVVAICRSSRR